MTELDALLQIHDLVLEQLHIASQIGQVLTWVVGFQLVIIFALAWRRV